MATKSPTKTKSASKGNGSAKKRTPSFEFKLFAPDAQEVFLVGEFNDWDPNGYRMRRFKDGTCKKSVPLKPGRYEYRFLVDGQWWTDPNNGEKTTNPYGSENSVINID